MSDDWSDDFGSLAIAGPSTLILPAHRQHSSNQIKRQPTSRKGPILFKPPPQPLSDPNNPDDIQGFDIPDSFPFESPPSIPIPTQRPSSDRPFHHLNKTIISTNPSGPGHVIRLKSKASSSALRDEATVKARVKAIQESYERDIDFTPAIKGKRLTLSPLKRRLHLPPAEDFDELGWDDEDEDQATLKAGGTLKGLLPPKRDRGDVPTVKPKTPIKKKVEEEEDSWDNDFESGGGVPLSFNRLRQVNASGSRAGANSRDGKGWNGLVKAGTQSAEFGSPASKKGWEDSPGRASETETSRTSISSGLSLPDREKQREREMDHVVVVEEEDMEDGLIITEPTLFSAGSGKKLNGLLELRRRPMAEGAGRGDRSFEDGLVLSGSRGQLSNRQLRQTQRARAAVQPRNVSGGRTAQEERAREKELERNWGRHTPIQPSPPQRERERTYSTLSRHPPQPRSQSATTAKETSIPQGETPHRTSKPRQSFDPRAMPPPPIPVHSSSRQQPTPSPLKGLRHQQSTYDLPSSTPLPSPRIHRNKSQASLQHVDIISPPSSIKGSKPTYSSSTSRLHDPTKSSASKSRPPVRDLFPETVRPTPSGFGSREEGYVAHHRVEQIRMTSKHPFRSTGAELDLVEEAPKKSVKSANRGYIPLPNAMDGRPEKRKRHEDKTKKSTGPTLTRYEKNNPDLKLNDIKLKYPNATLSHYDPERGWVGNEDALDIFDDIPTLPSTGPSLITLDSPSLNYTSSKKSGINSVLDANSTIKIVGDMKFDTERMCWLSIHDDEEPDPFEGLADDEDEDGGGGATITRANGRLVEIKLGLGGGGRMASESSVSTSGEWREVDEALRRECAEAKRRHKEEMSGWWVRGSGSGGKREEEEARKRRERDRLWAIRKLAVEPQEAS